MQECKDEITAPRSSLDKKMKLQKKREHLTDCLEEILETKSQWEKLSLKNRNALSSSPSIDQPLGRGRSEYRLQPPPEKALRSLSSD